MGAHSQLTPAAFTVESLAARWGCSEGVIRKMVRAGDLQCFRIGTLIRIRADEVERFECRTIPSNDSEKVSQSSIETPQESDAGTPLARPIGLARRQRPVNAGGSATVLRGPWEE
jgi:excisionase family DNA binding protein